MKALFAVLSLFAAMALVLPSSFGQDKDKKDAKDAKAEKKDAKDPEKKDPKEKKEIKKSDEPKEEKLVYGVEMVCKIKQMDANSNKDFTVEFQQPDQKKIYDFNVWKQQQLIGIAQAQGQDRINRTVNYQRELLQRQNNIYSMKDFPVRAGDGMKVRTLFPPVEYDDKGNMKKWTKKDLDALRGKTSLPGYPAEFDVLRGGQTVKIFLAKVQPKGAGTKGKKILDDDADLGMSRPEVVMILVMMDAPPRQ